MASYNVPNDTDTDEPNEIRPPSSSHQSDASSPGAFAGGETAIYATVLHDYDPFRPDEIPLRAGERIKVLSNDCRCSGDEGWWVGEEAKTGRIGVFPSTYVALPHRTLLPLDSDPLAEAVPQYSGSNSTSSDHAVLPALEASKQMLMTTTITVLQETNASDANESDPSSEVAKVVLRNENRKNTFQVKTIPSSEIIQQQFIGSGAFGTVYRGLWGDRDVALKVLNLPTAQLDKEASHLCRLSHTNVIQFFGVCELSNLNFPALVMEFAFGGPLNAVLLKHPVLAPSTLLDWAIQIATGMAYLHTDAKLVHRDLKSANILIREPLTHPYVDEELRHCTLVITDFGMACRSSELVPQQSKLGTVAYAAPEVCRQAGFSFKSDVWSYGVVLWELLTLELPFRTMEQPRLMYIIAMYNYTLHIPEDVPEMFTQLLRDCWSPVPERRPSFEDIIGRLKLTTCCNFLSIEADELSHIQTGWRDSIQAHHRAEQESAAATLSSSMTRSQLSVMEEALKVKMERLRHEHESLDRERRQLAERAHQIDLKEESCNRMMGTVGQQFMLLAVLAANLLKEIPCQPHPKPPPPRKRTFMLGLFRRWGSTGESSAHKVNTNASSTLPVPLTVSKDPQKISVDSQRPGTAVNASSQSLTLSSESLVTQTSCRLGCSQGGIPLISPPANMKHVVHVDPDWLTGNGINDSASMNMFPSALTDRFTDGQPDLLNASLCSTRTARYPIISPECFQPQSTTLCVRSTAVTTGDPKSLFEEKPDVNRPTHLWDAGGPPSIELIKRDRSLARMLRKAATEMNDILASTSSLSVGSSNFFIHPQPNGSPVGSTGCQHRDQSETEENQPALPSSSSSQWYPPGELGFEASNSTDSSPLDGRRRFISGPTMPICSSRSTSNTMGSEDAYFQCCPHCRCPQAAGATPPNHRSGISCNLHSQSNHDLFQVLYSAHPPTNLPQPNCIQSLQNTDRNHSDMSPCTPCVEQALWSAFQLAASFSCLTNSSYPQTDLKTQMNEHQVLSCTIGQKRSRSNESGASEPTTTTVGSNSRNQNATRSRFGRSKHFKHWKARPKDSEDQGSTVQPGCKSGVSLTDSRRRFQSADRWCPSHQCMIPTVCCTCRGMATLPEMIGECIVRQAELGDPHSPFLGMLAGSGRRPTASSNQLSRGAGRNFIDVTTFKKSPDRSHFSQPRLSQTMTDRATRCYPSVATTDHGWGRASFDVLPRLFRNAAATTGPNNSLTNLSPPRRDRSPTCHPSECVCTRPEAFTSLNAHNGSDLDAHTCFHGSCRPRLRSAEQVCSRSRAADFSSQPALALRSYNPVAASRDAYLKATKDGYLNRTTEVSDSLNPIPVDYAPEAQRKISLSGSNRSYYNPGFYTYSGDSDDLVGPAEASLNPAEVEEFLRNTARLASGPDTNRSGGHSDCEEGVEEVECSCHRYHTHLQREEEGDGVTLVPIDRWGPRFAEEEDAGNDDEIVVVIPPAVPPRSANRMQRKCSTSSSKGRSHSHDVQKSGTDSNSPRRLIQRTPAMRDSRRPDFPGLLQNHSEPETPASTWYRRTNSTGDHRWPVCDHGDPENIDRYNETERTDSPCGPFVSLDSAFL